MILAGTGIIPGEKRFLGFRRCFFDDVTIPGHVKSRWWLISTCFLCRRKLVGFDY